MNEKVNWSGWHTFGLLAIIIAMVIIGLQTPVWSRLAIWLCMLALLLLFCIVAGQGVTGLWHGLLMDERKRMSLSRLQLTLWTIIILSAFLTAVLSNISGGASDPLSIAVPEELWLLMGISTTSLIGSPLIRSSKIRQQPKGGPKEARNAYVKRAKLEEDDIDVKGLVVYNAKSKMARWSNMFEGEEVDNADILDLGKMQMFYFTLILVLVYLINLGSMFRGEAPIIDALPTVSASMVALLAISHAGYLFNKAVTHSQTE